MRRSQAVGVLARRQLTLDLDTPGEGGVKARQVSIYVHLDDENGTTEGHVEGGGGISAEQVRQWCTNPDTRVVITPVIDLNLNDSTDAYTIPDRMRDHVVLRDPKCVFPRCSVSSRRGDLDHTQSWHTGGTTTPENLAPLCRRHHRAKTHGGWTYRRTRHGHYRWTSPLGQVATHHRQHRRP